MFGIIYWLISGTAMLSDSIGNERYKEKQRQEVYGKEFRLYYDRKGRKFWDGEQVFDSYTHDKKHHWVLVKKDGTIVWDYTQREKDRIRKIREEHDKECKEKAIREGKLYYRTLIRGCFHKIELSTGRTFDCRTGGGAIYRYYKRYYYLRENLFKEYLEKIEITRDEYYALGCDR